MKRETLSSSSRLGFLQRVNRCSPPQHCRSQRRARIRSLSPTMAISLHDHALGKTAQFIAACRAVESDKPQETRKFSEPWARKFASETGTELLRLVAEEYSVSLQAIINIITARTCFLDDVVNRATSRESPKIRQVVIAAVGGDGRPYRMRFPDDVVVFEMDLPDVMKFRSKIFAEAQAQPTCDLRSIEVDLAKDGWAEALVAAGFDPSEPSVWTMEGLLTYLTEEECKKFVSQIATLCTPGSVICGDVYSPSFFTRESLAGFKKLWADFGAAPACSSIEDPKAFFAEFGFQTIVKVYKELAVELDVGFSGILGFPSAHSEQEEKNSSETNYYFEATK
ncbi:hypothetical protein BSKO_10465 [Bryopsis sp. KO-2023]|nr:hypothetical protein BSKO_10465 [Bryopsis sp. KO-2023]